MVNEWLIIFCYVLTIFGISWSMVYSVGPFYIFEKTRDFFSNLHPNLKHLFGCMMCMPTEISLIASLCNILLFPHMPLTPFNIIIDNTDLWWIIIFADGFFAGGCCYIINTILETFESITNKNEQG